MGVDDITISGTVARTTLPGCVVGRRAVVVRRDDRVTIRQKGRVLGQWSGDEARLRTSRNYVTDSKTPSWAVVLGILLLPLFFIGIVFFFIRQEGYVSVVTVSVIVDGRSVITLERHGLVAHPPSPAFA
jgi:hypothetical protein